MPISNSPGNNYRPRSEGYVFSLSVHRGCGGGGSYVKVWREPPQVKVKVWVKVGGSPRSRSGSRSRGEPPPGQGKKRQGARAVRLLEDSLVQPYIAHIQMIVQS